VRDGDIEAVALDLVAAIATVDIGAFDRGASQFFNLIDLIGEAVPVLQPNS